MDGDVGTVGVAGTQRGRVGRSRGWRQVALLAVAVAGMFGAGVWGLLVPRNSSSTTGVSSVATVSLPDGTLRVHGLVDKQVGQTMPGMGATEDVPAGLRRFAVTITLGATRGRPLAYSRRGFTVFGPGVKPVSPVSGQLEQGSLLPGQAISGSLTFDVPDDSRSLSLRFGNAPAVRLPSLPPPLEKDLGREHGGKQTPGHHGSGSATKPGSAGFNCPPQLSKSCPP